MNHSSASGPHPLANIDLLNTRRLTIYSVLWLGITVIFIFFLYHLPLKSVVSQEIILALFAPFLCLVFLRSALHLRALLQIEHRRMTLLRGEGSARVLELPTSQQAPLSVPLQIQWTINSKVFGSLTITLFLLMVVILVPLLVTLQRVADLFIFGGTTLFVALFFLAGGAFALTSLVAFKKCIMVTASGVQVEVRGNLTPTQISVDWDEGLLFVCYRLPNFFVKKQRLIYYELSSATQRITWISAGDTQPFFWFWRPLPSSKEYDRHMRILLPLIVEKTGLSLYDLCE